MRVSAVAKTIVAAVGAGVTAVTVAVGDDILTTTEAINVALAVLTALGVYVVPNKNDEDDGGAISSPESE